MKKMLSLLVALLLATALGLAVQKHSGYLLISYGSWRIESSFWIGLAAILIAFVLFYLLLRLLSHLFRLRGQLQRWSKGRNRSKAQSITHRGLCELAEGHWKKAEKLLIKGAESSPDPLINYLSAAQAANHLNQSERRDHYLQQAARLDQSSKVAVGLTQAHLQIQSEQWEQALATLQHLQELSPQQTYTLCLLLDVYQKLGDWSAQNKLLPALEKANALTATELDSIRIQCCQAELRSKIQQHTFDPSWKQLPRKYQQLPELACLAIDYWLQQRKDDQAIELIEAVLKKSWDSALVTRYAKAHSQHAAKQLKTAENWLKQHSNDSELLFTLGLLSERNQLWGKAKDYFTESLAITASTKAHYQLARLYQKQGELTQAMQHFQEAAQLAQGSEANT